MTLIESFQQELEQEALTTRKMLQRVPMDQLTWKPHPKSMTLAALVGHVAELPSWVAMAVDTDELDFAANPYAPPVFSTSEELLAIFENYLNQGRDALKRATPEELEKPWTLRQGENIFLTDPKREVIRMSLSQTIHHRAQLGVYLRLLNIPIPGSYGPSADENEFNYVEAETA